MACERHPLTKCPNTEAVESVVEDPGMHLGEQLDPQWNVIIPQWNAIKPTDRCACADWYSSLQGKVTSTADSSCFMR